MRLALAPLAVALIGTACSGSGEPAERQQHGALLASGAADCLSRSPADGDLARSGARRAAATSALTAERLETVATIAGVRPARVVDRAEVLSEAEHAMAVRSQALEAATGDQVVVVTVPELGALSIEEFGLALGNSWGVGQPELDNGVLLLMARSERRVRVEVGCGLEAVLTDAGAAEIVAAMVEHFRKGDFEQGIAAGLGAIDATLRARPERRRAP